MTLATCTDANGAPLLSQMSSILEEQKKHLLCLQDPPGISLYTVTGSICKGGVTLPVSCCTRGTTSLESFHCHGHLASFIPGTSVSDMHYLAYLLEGVTRWNQAHALWQHQLPPVLLRALLGHHPFHAGQIQSQAAGQEGSNHPRSSTSRQNRQQSHQSSLIT